MACEGGGGRALGVEGVVRVKGTAAYGGIMTNSNGKRNACFVRTKRVLRDMLCINKAQGIEGRPGGEGAGRAGTWCTWLGLAAGAWPARAQCSRCSLPQPLNAQPCFPSTVARAVRPLSHLQRLRLIPYATLLNICRTLYVASLAPCRLRTCFIPSPLTLTPPFPKQPLSCALP